MYGLLHYPFDERRSCMRLSTDFDDALLDDAYFVEDIRTYLELVANEQPMKMTAKGNLPRKLCRELVARDICEAMGFWFAEHNIMKEADCLYINMINNYTQISEITKKEHNRLSLTRWGEKLLAESDPDFYDAIFRTYARIFDWSFTDGRPHSPIIQASFPFSIFLLQRYGAEERRPEFYIKKIVRAFPDALRDFYKDSHFTPADYFRSCYRTRVIERFLRRFGMIEIEGWDKNNRGWTSDYLLKKTPLIDAFVRWERD